VKASSKSITGGLHFFILFGRVSTASWRTSGFSRQQVRAVSLQATPAMLTQQGNRRLSASELSSPSNW
jgi:hypothetical protein